MYVLLLDKLERQVLADRGAAATLMAAGAKGVTFPTLAEQRAMFDAALAEDPKAEDTEQQQLRKALGV